MLIERIGRHIRNEGVAATARKAAGYVFHLCAGNIYRNHVELMFENDLTGPMPDVPANRLTVREFIPDDAQTLQQFIGKHNVHADFGLKRFAYNSSHGYRAVLGTTLDGELVGYGWLCDRSQSHPGRRLHGFKLGAGELYVFDLFVAPPFRRSTMSLEFLIRAQHLGRQRGFGRIFSNVLESNRKSVRLHHQAGFRETERHRVHTFFNLVMVCGRHAVFRNSLWF